MDYVVENNMIKATGYLDMRDFKADGAIDNLATNVAGHKNKGWFDVAINFNATLSNQCND